MTDTARTGPGAIDDGAAPAAVAAPVERHDDPVIVGAGPAGLAAAYTLRRAGFAPRVLERTDSVCSSWRAHYAGLRLNSPRAISSLPGVRLPRSYGTWVARDDWIDYVERYAERTGVPIRHGVAVERIDRDDGGRWLLRTSEGDVSAPRVVVATGLHAIPYVPDWPGRDAFAGELIHSAEYQVPEPYRGRDVLVVGMGQTGSDIAAELLRAGVGRLRVALRTPPIVFPWKRWPSIVSHIVNLTRGRYPDSLNDFNSRRLHRLFWGDLRPYGYPAPYGGLASEAKRKRGMLAYDAGFGFTIDKGLIPAVKRGEAQFVPAVDRFEGRDVVLAGGERIQPDVVIAATGRRPNLRLLVGHLDVLGRDARPLEHGGACAPGAPGLHFIGYRLPPPQLPELRLDARAIARRAARDAAVR